jgi:CHAT domain-containing protein
MASEYAELSDDVSTRLNAAMNLAGTYMHTAVVPLAIKHYERARTLARRTGSVRSLDHISKNLIALYWASPETRDQGDALFVEEFASSDCGDASSRAKRIELLLTRAEHEAAEGNGARGRSDLAKAYELWFREGVDNRTLMRIVHTEASMTVDDHPMEALEMLEEARALAESLPQWEGEHIFAEVNARALIRLGRRDEAGIVLDQAIETHENKHAALAGNALLRRSLLARQTGVYHEYVGSLVDDGRFEEALRIADYLGARTLRDTLASGTEVRDPRTAQVVEAERTIVRLNRDLLSSRRGDGGRARKLSELKNARLRLDELQSRLKAVHDRPGASPPAALDLSAIPERTALIKFVVTKGRTFVFVAKPNTPVVARIIPIAADDLSRDVDALRSRLESRDLGYQSGAVSIYRRLIEPIEADLRNVDRLLLIPDGPLWLLPFQAVSDPQRKYLVERYEIAYAPSLSWIGESTRSRARAESILAIGDPQVGVATRARVRAAYPARDIGGLPDAAREAREVAGLYRQRRLLTGHEARESTLKKDAATYDVIHLATHAFLEQSQPMYSSILLTAGSDDDEDGLLEVREIEALDLNANLVVLSACSTANGRVVAGEGVVGLTWAFLSRGVPNVVGSQWQAESESTASLMIRFHRHLVAGERPAAALRKAQREMLGDRRYQHPYYWAAFTIVGSP